MACSNCKQQKIKIKEDIQDSVSSISKIVVWVVVVWVVLGIYGLVTFIGKFL
jgi:hypothetical protein